MMSLKYDNFRFYWAVDTEKKRLHSKVIVPLRWNSKRLNRLFHFLDHYQRKTLPFQFMVFRMMLVSSLESKPRTKRQTYMLLMRPQMEHQYH